MARNLPEKVGFAPDLSERWSDPQTKAQASLTAPGQSWCLSEDFLFSLLALPLHFLTSSSSLPGSVGLLPAGLPFILSPCFHCYRPLSRAIPPWPAGQEASLRLSSLYSPSSSFSRDKSKNSLLTDLPFPLAP